MIKELRIGKIIFLSSMIISIPLWLPLFVLHGLFTGLLRYISFYYSYFNKHNEIQYGDYLVQKKEGKWKDSMPHPLSPNKFAFITFFLIVGRAIKNLPAGSLFDSAKASVISFWEKAYFSFFPQSTIKIEQGAIYYPRRESKSKLPV